MRPLAFLWGLIAFVAFWAALIWGIVFLGYNVLPKKYKDQIYTEDSRLRNWPIKGQENETLRPPKGGDAGGGGAEMQEGAETPQGEVKEGEAKEGEGIIQPKVSLAKQMAAQSPPPHIPFAADGEGGGPADTALLIDLLLLAAFILPTALIGAVSCGMCKQGFGKATKRSTHVLIGSLLLGVVFWRWLPVPEDVWNKPHLKTMLQYLFWSGWGVALLGTFLIGHFRFTGLRPALLYFLGKEDPPAAPGGLAAVGRHLVLLGLLVGLLATPKMTLGHLLFSAPLALFVVAWWAVASKKKPAAAEPAAAPK